MGGEDDHKLLACVDVTSKWKRTTTPLLAFLVCTNTILPFTGIFANCSTDITF